MPKIKIGRFQYIECGESIQSEMDKYSQLFWVTESFWFFGGCTCFMCITVPAGQNLYNAALPKSKTL